METIISKSDLFDFLEKKQNEAQAEFTINLALLNGEKENVDGIKTLKDFVEVSKTLANHHERLGFVLGKVEMIKDLLENFK